MFTARFQAWVRAGARRIVPALQSLGLSPNALTVIGLCICAVSAVLIALGNLLAGGLVLLLASAFDILDGALARVTGKTYSYGAFLDSTSDRYAEAFTAIALLWYFLFHTHSTLESMLVIFMLSGSQLVSYVRARAQSLGFSCDGGLLARPERVVITAAGLIIAPALVWALWILAVLTNLTAVQRILLVWRQSRAAEKPVEEGRSPAPAPHSPRSPSQATDPPTTF